MPLVTDVRRLVQWMLAGGRTPTVKGRLRVRDAAEATAQLAVTDPALLWNLAVYTGLVEVEGTAIFDGEEFDPLGTWAAVVEFIVEKETGGAVTGDGSLDEELYGLCDMLYRLQAPVPIPSSPTTSRRSGWSRTGRSTFRRSCGGSPTAGWPSPGTRPWS
ncbi:hypothetical protein ACFQX6_23795 [Streptosporangium lutulentum]